MTELDPDVLKKYKAIIVRSLNLIDEVANKAGILANAEAYKINLVLSRTKPDPDTLAALFELHKTLGDSIRTIVDIGHELDKTELLDNLEDLDLGEKT